MQAGRPASVRKLVPSRPRTGSGQLSPRAARCSATARGGTDEVPTVEVVVHAQVRPFGRALRVLPAVRVSARAVAAVEPGTP